MNIKNIRTGKQVLNLNIKYTIMDKENSVTWNIDNDNNILINLLFKLINLLINISLPTKNKEIDKMFITRIFRINSLKNENPKIPQVTIMNKNHKFIHSNMQKLL